MESRSCLRVLLRASTATVSVRLRRTSRRSSWWTTGGTASSPSLVQRKPHLRRLRCAGCQVRGPAKDGPRGLKSGILARGFARARSSGCSYEVLVAFSCRGQGYCPSCGASIGPNDAYPLPAVRLVDSRTLLPLPSTDEATRPLLRLHLYVRDPFHGPRGQAYARLTARHGNDTPSGPWKSTGRFLFTRLPAGSMRETEGR